ncbi:MAG: Sec-independent protein translocase protein TatB [Propionivibrio sp.]
MFDISFSELMLIGIVALVVIGPERLPKVARTAGHLFGRLQRYVNDVKADISREMQLDELKKLKGELQDSASSFQRSMTSEIANVEKAANEAVRGVREELTPLVEGAPSAKNDASEAAGEPGPGVTQVEATKTAGDDAAATAASSSTPVHKA